MTVCRAPTEIVNRNPEKCPILFEFTQNNDRHLIGSADSAVAKSRIPQAYSLLCLGPVYWQLSGITKSMRGGFITRLRIATPLAISFDGKKMGRGSLG